MDSSRTLLMACATVMEEALPLLPPGMGHRVFDFGLHVNPARLRGTLQQAIDSLCGQYDTILLGYGMCSQGILGLHAEGCRLVAPRVDDCIALFLGSSAAYAQQCRREPGTYFLTKGWIEVGDTPFSDYERSRERCGEEKAAHIFKIMMGNYRRLALINTGGYGLEKYREYARNAAARFGLRFEEIEGSQSFLRRLILGPWDGDFVVLEPGESFRAAQFPPFDTGPA